MKILYLTDPELDYLADQLYTGLWRLLGWESVIDYPRKPAYHELSSKAWYLPQNPARQYERDEVLAGLERHDFDLVVLSSPRRRSTEAVEDLAGKCRLPPLVLVDGEDDCHIRRELFRRLRCSLYFKREYRWDSAAGLRGRCERWREFRWDHDLFQRTYPLPFSAILETIPTKPETELDLDISFVGRASHRKRAIAVRLLNGDREIKFEGWVYLDPTDRRSKLAPGLFSTLLAKCKGDPRVGHSECGRGLSSEEYYGLLARSRIGLSIRGGGYDTPRYWEIVASRRLLLAERPDICIPFNFEHGKHALFCRSDFSDLTELVRTYVRDDGARQAIVGTATPICSNIIRANAGRSTF